MDLVHSPVGMVVLAALVPDCVSTLAGFGTALLAAALVLTGWLIGRLMRALRAKLGYPDPSDVRGPRSPGHTVQDVAARLRHDSPGGWTAGETRWTLAHEHAWYSSPDYRTFLYVVIVVVLSWAFGLHFAHQFCS
ncbi:MAG TPA: hypothetical protein VFE37_26850 [Chloroflexota bacterium]|nr:hypothetical protein [Chloroflexota bacterium]